MRIDGKEIRSVKALYHNNCVAIPRIELRDHNGSLSAYYLGEYYVR